MIGDIPNSDLVIVTSPNNHYHFLVYCQQVTIAALVVDMPAKNISSSRRAHQRNARVYAQILPGCQEQFLVRPASFGQ